jgi:DNA-binding SARP family transcriptional activator
MLEFRVLGPLEVCSGGVPIALPGLASRRVLAALVLRPGTWVSTDRLMDELWGGQPPVSGRKALQMHVLRLRRAFDAAEPGSSRVLASGPAGYRLEVDPEQVDSARFERMAQATGDTARERDLLAAGLALWRGEPLAELALDGALAVELDRIEELRLHALERRLHADLELGRHVDVIAELQRLVAEHPWREGLYFELMVALYRAGRHADALDVYRRARDGFIQELGLEPSPRLRALEEAILRHDASLHSEDSGGGHLGATSVAAWWTSERLRASVLVRAVATGPEFAGRGRELALVRAAWADVADGLRRGVLIAGEPGIGKTRLAAELAREVSRGNGLVLYGKCDDGFAAPAQPFAEALSSYVAACPEDVLRSQIGTCAGDLLPVLPQLATWLPDLAAHTPATPQLARLRTLEAVGQLLNAATAIAPVLLVLDDMHWADELSLSLVRHILRADVEMRLLIIATYRDTEPSRSPLMTDVMTGLGRQPGVSRIELDGLEAPAIATILVDSGRESAHAERVREVTRGNPFFVAEVARALDGHADPGTSITTRARDVVRWRLARLPPGTTDVLAVAALAGAQVQVDVIAAAAEMDLESALDAFEAAEHARLVRAAGAMDEFVFAHALVRHAIIDDLSASRRARLHARLARALQRIAATRRVAAGDLAVHFAGAGSLVDPAETVRYARVAADEAGARLAFDVAANHYEQALSALEHLPDVPTEARLELQLAHGHALRLAGDIRADAVLRRLAVDAEVAGDGVTMAQAVLTLALGLETRFLREDVNLVGLTRRALGLLPEQDSAARARLLGFLAHAAAYSLSNVERESLSMHALAMARRVRDPTALAATLKARSWILMGPGNQEHRLALADELVAVGRRGPPDAETDGHVFRHIALVELGDRDGAEAAIAAARAAARLPVSRWTVSVWRAIRTLLAGRFAEVEEDCAHAAEAAHEAGFPPAIARPADLAARGLARVGPNVMWSLRALQGRLPEFELPFREYVEPMIERPPWTFVYEAQLALQLVDRDRAQRALTRAFDEGLTRQPSGLAWAATLVTAAEVCATLGDRGHAAQLYVTLAPHAHVMTATAGPLALAVGRLAYVLGRPDEAVTQFRRAVASCEHMDTVAYLPAARHLLGHLLPTPEGRRLIERARTQASEIGLVLPQH